MKLNGLILAGGHSNRMGKDKSSLEYYDKSQRTHLFELLDGFCNEVFISCRKEQAKKWKEVYPYLYDTSKDTGPLAGILAALEYQKEIPWLVIACDLPYLTPHTITYLITQRNPSKIATAYQNPITFSPEPLMTIWEPSAYTGILKALQKGCKSPRKILVDSNCQLVSPLQTEALKNVNDWKTYQEVRQKLKKEKE